MATDWYGKTYFPTASAGGSSGIGYGVAPSELATQTAKSNLAAMPYNQKIADMINAANVAAQKRAQEARIPMGGELEELSSKNIADELAGRLSGSYLENLYSRLAQQWGARGYGVDTNAINAAALRAIGLDTEKLQAAGQEHLTAATARSPIAPLFDYGKLITEPSVYAGASASRAALAERAREADAELAAKYAAIAASLTGRGGGGYGGGGGGYRAYRPGETPDLTDLSPTLYSLGTGTTVSPEPTRYPSEFDFLTGEVQPGAMGYQPTSSGTMYMGSPEDYYADLDAWAAEAGFEG